MDYFYNAGPGVKFAIIILIIFAFSGLFMKGGKGGGGNKSGGTK